MRERSKSDTELQYSVCLENSQLQRIKRREVWQGIFPPGTGSQALAGGRLPAKAPPLSRWERLSPSPRHLIHDLLSGESAKALMIEEPLANCWPGEAAGLHNPALFCQPLAPPWGLAASGRCSRAGFPDGCRVRWGRRRCHFSHCTQETFPSPPHACAQHRAKGEGTPPHEGPRAWGEGADQKQPLLRARWIEEGPRSAFRPSALFFLIIGADSEIFSGSARLS